MEYRPLILPVDKQHILRRAEEGWEYLVQENANLRKSYYLYPNEVDADTYNFEGYAGDIKDVDSGIVVTMYDEGTRLSQSYNMKGQVIRQDELSMTLVYESLARCQSRKVIARLHEKKDTAVFLPKLQTVYLPVDDSHQIVQTLTGLWRYISKSSGRTYVFMRSEFDVHHDSVAVTPFDRSIRVYIDGKAEVMKMPDVVTYLISRENEMCFDDKVEFSVNMSLILNRRGWGTYIHLFDKGMRLHAFKLDDGDEVPENIPHILDLEHMVDAMGTVALYKDAYEDELVMPDGQYVPQNVFYPAIRIARPKSDSPFYDQAGLIRRYRNRNNRRVELRGTVG